MMVQLMTQKYSRTDNRFKVITQKNKGLEKLGESYNTALEQCDGKWIAVLEGDDYWHPEKLSTYLDELSESKAVLAWGTAYAVNSTSKVLGEFPRKKFQRNANNSPASSFLNDYLLNSFVPSPTLMFRTDCLRQMGGVIQPKGMHVVDYPTVLAMSLKGEFRFIKQPLVYYRIHSNQATSSGGFGADSAARYAQEFFKALPVNTRASLNLRSKQIDNRVAQRRALNHFHRGRIALIQGDFKNAKRFFRSMSDCHAPSIIARTCLGLLHSALGIDLEWMARLLGLRPLK